MPSYESLEKKQSDLRRKALNGSMFVGPYSTTAITSLTGVGGALSTLPSGMIDAGLISDDGMAFARSVSRSESTSFGRVQPTRSDVTSDVTTVSVTLQETNKTAIELYTGIDLTGVTPTAGGEIKLSKPEVLPDRFYRVLCLAVDKTTDGDLYYGRYFPRIKVTDYSDQAFAKSDDGIVWPVTLTAYVDDTLGTAESLFFGGPGWTAALVKMGFPAAA